MNTPSGSSSIVRLATALSMAMSSACSVGTPIEDERRDADAVIADATQETSSEVSETLSGQDAGQTDTPLDSNEGSSNDTQEVADQTDAGSGDTDAVDGIDATDIAADATSTDDAQDQDGGTDVKDVSLPADATKLDNPGANACINTWKAGKKVDPCTIKDKKYAEKVQIDCNGTLQEALSKLSGGTNLNKSQPGTFLVASSDPKTPYVIAFVKTNAANSSAPWLLVKEGKRTIAFYGNAGDISAVTTMQQTSDDPNCAIWESYTVQSDGTTSKVEQKQAAEKITGESCAEPDWTKAVALCADATATVGDVCTKEDNDTLLTHGETEAIPVDAAKSTITSIINTLKQLTAKLGLTSDLGI